MQKHILGGLILAAQPSSAETLYMSLGISENGADV
jgi:hypothetical protein